MCESRAPRGGERSDHPRVAAAALLRESLILWGIPGDVSVGADGTLHVAASGQPPIHIQPALPDLPFRWLVTIGERRRGAVSLVAVLRQVRTALDPGYVMGRVRIAATPPEEG